MKIPGTPAQTATVVRQRVWIIPAAAGVPWLVGFVSIFLVAPTNAGVGTWSAYASFHTGSNFGNLLALSLWTCATLLAAWMCFRGTGRASVRALCAYGVSAALSLYPAAVLSYAVSHVVAIEDTFAYRDSLAGPLVLSGVVALAAALVLAIWARRRGSQASQSGEAQ